MSGKTAFVFPGQGSQWVGMGLDLYQSFSSARAIFEQADKVLGFPLSRLCFEGPEDELRQTKNAQPALVMASFACLEALKESKKLPNPSFVAGHSLGEYTALAYAQVFDFQTAVYLAHERGRLMYEAGVKRPGGMLAIIGLDEGVVAGVCEETGTYMANVNCPGQIAISGAEENLVKAKDLAQSRGARRVIPLAVSGAFHTPMMQPAVDGMSSVLEKVSFNEPVLPVIANTTAQALPRAEQIKGELLNQLTSSVQWQRSVEYMVKEGVSTFIEIGPGKVLTGLIKRINSDSQTINIGDAESVKAFPG